MPRGENESLHGNTTKNLANVLADILELGLQLLNDAAVAHKVFKHSYGVLSEHLSSGFLLTLHEFQVVSERLHSQEHIFGSDFTDDILTVQIDFTTLGTINCFKDKGRNISRKSFANLHSVKVRTQKRLTILIRSITAHETSGGLRVRRSEHNRAADTTRTNIDRVDRRWIV